MTGWRLLRTAATATLVPVDLADHDRIDEMAGALAERFGRIDILVGNAAVLGGLAPLAHVEPERWAEAMNVNLTANWRLIRAFEPLLHQSRAGPRHFCHQRRHARRVPLLGALCREQGGARSAGPDLGGGTGEDRHPHQHPRSRRRPHPDAR